MSLDPNFTWFSPTFIGSDVKIPSYGDRDASIWTLEKKLGERYTRITAPEAHEPNWPSEAWATYQCHNVENIEEKAAIKIRLQVPHIGSESGPPNLRAAQALQQPSNYVHREIKALGMLAAAGCQSAPCLLGHVQHKQDDTMWVPQGYIVYILMTWCPGDQLLGFWGKELPERQQIREAFKVAFLECLRCGVISLQVRLDNILWDAENGKCYFFDFRKWRMRQPFDKWTDERWEFAFLKRGGKSDD